MLVGHFAVAMGAKKIAPKTSLGTLVAAAMFLDLLWPVFLLIGLEQVRIDETATKFTPLDFVHYPWSHSLEMSVLWGAAFGAAYVVIKRNARTASILGLLVVSHWLLDFVTHRADLPLFMFGDTKVGLGLWNNVWLTLGVELILFAIGIRLYTSATKARDGIGQWGFVATIAILLLFYFGASFGPPPPDATLIGISALALYFFIPLTAWIDRHRTS